MNYDRELSLMIAEFRQSDATRVVVYEAELPRSGFVVVTVDEESGGIVGRPVEFDDALAAVAYAKEIS